MEDTAKYLIHADITANGVVERSDVVGAIFGQTEGLLGNDLDLRDLQQSSKVGRIDVEVESEGGTSFGRVTIASSLDRVETAILAAAFETLERVGPCRAHLEVRRIEDVRAAKRREVVDRAKDLLSTAFDESVMSSTELLEEVRESVRVEDIAEYEGLPAGPRVPTSDAVVVVEGRADVLTLLGVGIKNAVAVEGTNVPDAVADLTWTRTTTAFLDGDRGGDLILRELAQVGDVDYVARAPDGRSVEDLERHEVVAALREKAPYDAAAAAGDVGTEAATDGSARPAPERGDAGTDPVESTASADSTGGGVAAPTTDAGPDGSTPAADGASPDGTTDGAAGDATGDEAAAGSAGTAGEADPEADDATAEGPTSLRDQVAAVVAAESGSVRLLADDWSVVSSGDAEDAFDLVAEAETPPHAVVVDAAVTQRLLDVAAQRGVSHVVGRDRGGFTKRPAAVRVLTADELLGDA